MKLNVRFFASIFYCTQSFFIVTAATTAEEAIHDLMGRYHRAVTVLEVGRSSEAYLFTLAKRYPGSYILMDRKLSQSAEQLEELFYKNIVFLHPPKIDTGLIAELGKCEHFDVAIIHQGDHLFDSEQIFASSLQLLLALGDHIFVEIPQHLVAVAKAVHACDVVQTSATSCFCYFEMHKTCITKARWTAAEEGTTSYGIVSNFEEKRMAKQSTGTTSTWIPGINLLTFLMLRGVYPTDDMMREQLKTFKHIDHNDLVIGNMVVQGRQIVPIDFADKRRNISPEVCIKAALKTLIKDKRFKKDIYSLLQKYTKYIHHHKRKFHFKS